MSKNISFKSELAFIDVHKFTSLLPAIRLALKKTILVERRRETTTLGRSHFTRFLPFAVVLLQTAAKMIPSRLKHCSYNSRYRTNYSCLLVCAFLPFLLPGRHYS